MVSERSSGWSPNICRRSDNNIVRIESGSASEPPLSAIAAALALEPHSLPARSAMAIRGLQLSAARSFNLGGMVGLASASLGPWSVAQRRNSLL